MRNFPLVVLISGLVTLGLSSAGLTESGRQASNTGQALPSDPPVFRVGVDVVRVDAVVTDRKGRVVTDLTADDFEILQDGEPQQIVAARFVSIEAPARSVAPKLDKKGEAPVPVPPSAGRTFANAGEVQRTIAIVVDDLGIAWDNMEPTRRALRKFVDEEIHDGDLVALLKTGKSISALQQFTTDKRRLYSAVDQLQWNGFSRQGVSSFESLNNFISNAGIAGIDYNAGPRDRVPSGERGGTNVDSLRNAMMASGTLGALSLVVRGVNELPGRKTIILISEGFRLMDDEFQPNFLVAGPLRQLLDQAMRAGVVINTIDPRGLATAGLTAEDNTKAMGTAVTRAAGEDRRTLLLNMQENLTFLAEETGGLALLNSNDVAHSLKRVSDDQRGYYVLGYSPPPDTFAKPGKTARYHRLSVRVKREGVKVRTRKGFVGIADDDVPPTAPGSEQELYRTATSPFAAASLPLRATVLHGYRPGEGSFVRALLHVQGQGLTFGKNDAGREVATLDVMALVFDASGAAVAGRDASFEVERTRDADGSAEAGVVFSMTVPIARPGGYQVRFAVRDQATGAMGAAGQFVEAADVSDGDFALSGLVLGEEARGQRTIAVAAADDQTPTGPSPILRVFDRGSRLVYACEIYNADAPVETRISVWRDGRPVFTAPPATLSPGDTKGKGLPAGGGIRLGDRMAPGEYVVQMAAATRTKKGRGKPVAAVQWVEFEVR